MIFAEVVCKSLVCRFLTVYIKYIVVVGKLFCLFLAHWMALQNLYSGRLNLLHHASGPVNNFISSPDVHAVTDTGLRINYNPPPPPVAPPVDYQPPYFPPPYSIPSEYHQHVQVMAPGPAAPPHQFDPYRVYQSQQPPAPAPHQLMPQPPVNGHHHAHLHPPAGYYHHADRYLFADALHRGVGVGGGGGGGGFAVPPGPELVARGAGGMEYGCGGASQPPQPGVVHSERAVSPTATYKLERDASDSTLTTTTTTPCLRLIADCNDDRDQVRTFRHVDRRLHVYSNSNRMKL